MEPATIMKSENRNDEASANIAAVDMKLEVVVIPVSDIDRATEFYRTADRTVRPKMKDLAHPDGNSWLLQEITTRLAGRIDTGTTSFGSATDLVSALRRAEAAHGEHEKRTGQARRKLGRLVCGVYGGRTSRDGASQMTYRGG